jgi:hypothetical protein
LYTRSGIFQYFMELEGSLPYSQVPSTGAYPDPDQSSLYHPHSISLRSILILFTRLHLGLPSGLLSSGFPAKILYSFLFSFVLYSLPISSSLTFHFNYTWRREVMKLLIVNFSPISCNIIPLRSKYSPRHQTDIYIQITRKPRHL